MYFATEVQPGEKCIIKGHENEPLTICNLDGDVLATIQPSGSWTHEKLISLDLSYVATGYGADALLGSQWIGSTEC